MRTNTTYAGEKFRDSIRGANSIRIINVKPLIKLSFEGMLLHANSTGIDFLEMLSDYIKSPSIKYLIQSCPGMLDEHCNLDISVRIHDTVYYFSVVAFKEAGFVGMYGYRTVHVGKPGPLVA